MPLLVSRKFHFLSDFSVKTYDHLKFFMAILMEDDQASLQLKVNHSVILRQSLGPLLKSLKRIGTLLLMAETYLYMLKDAKFLA